MRCGISEGRGQMANQILYRFILKVSLNYIFTISLEYVKRIGNNLLFIQPGIAKSKSGRHIILVFLIHFQKKKCMLF